VRGQAETGLRIIPLPCRVSDTVATPDGFDFAYHVAAETLSSQLDTIDKLDARWGVLTTDYSPASLPNELSIALRLASSATLSGVASLGVGEG